MDGLHDLRLMALLHELVRRRDTGDRRGVLGIDHSKVAGCMEGGGRSATW